MKILHKPIIINLFAGPGTGKSTVAAQIFSELKWKGINCELVTEFAKELVYSESHDELSRQEDVFEEQLSRVERLIGKVDVIITDSPILFSMVYGENKSKTFIQKVIDEHRKHWNINFLLNRKKPYVKVGRIQDEDGARKKDVEILNMLNNWNEQYIIVDATKQDVNYTIIPFIEQTLKIIKANEQDSL